jgi:hypothetical protein
VFVTLRALAVVALAGLLASGCGLVATDRGPQSPPFEFLYQPTSGDGYMNQTLAITNLTTLSYAPFLKLAAVDETGEVLQSVTVSTVYGSDRAALVVPARTSIVDVMRFSGEHVDRVADVRATVIDALFVDYPTITAEPTVTPLDGSGVAVTRNDVFTRVRVHNDNDRPITVRLLYIIWDMPLEGRTQQADRTEPIGDLVTVAAHGETEVPVSPDDAALIRQSSGTAPTSIKAYHSR